MSTSTVENSFVSCENKPSNMLSNRINGEQSYESETAKLISIIDIFYQPAHSQTTDDRKNAELYLNKMSECAIGYQVCLKLFTSGSSINNNNVLFYCLHVFENAIKYQWSNLSMNEQCILSSILLQFIHDMCSNDNEKYIISEFVKKKIAQLIVTLIKLQYLSIRKSFFKFRHYFLQKFHTHSHTKQRVMFFAVIWFQSMGHVLWDYD